MDHMTRNLTVEGGKELKQEEEYVKNHGIGHNAGQRSHLLLSWIESRKFPYNETDNKEKGWTRSKSGGEKTGCQNGGQPEVPARQTLVEESGYGMDTKAQGMER